MAFIDIRLIKPLIKVSGLFVFQLPNTRLFPKLSLMEHIRHIYPLLLKEQTRLFPKLFLMEHIRHTYPKVLKE